MDEKTGATFLGILTRHGVEHAQLFHEEIPRALMGKRSPLVYCTRLDEDLAKLRLVNLLILYKAWKAQGTLPPDARQ